MEYKLVQVNETGNKKAGHATLAGPRKRHAKSYDSICLFYNLPYLNIMFQYPTSDQLLRRTYEQAEESEPGAIPVLPGSKITGNGTFTRHFPYLHAVDGIAYEG